MFNAFHLAREKAALAAALVFFVVHLAPGQTFVHPGGLHTQADFDRMKAKVAANASPWVDSYNQLTPLSQANTGWPWAPVTQIVRGVSPNNYARSQKDALAIYYLALRWRITGDTNFAEKAIQGCDAWASTMTNGVGGNSNWALGAGICGYEFAVAGEALRGYTNWSQTSISNYCNFLKLFAGGNDNFLYAHNNTCDSHYWCNWDACNAASLMACGVFCDDTNMFNRAVTYLKQGNGNGNLTAAAWFVHTNGLAQWQESGRDQAHTMDGIAWIGVALQVAWNQGVDLYGFDNNLFLRGLEYSAKYNLWNDVPYQSYLVCEGASFAWGTSALNAGSRGFLPPTWDLFYNHYVNKRGLSAPWTAAAATALRPDGFYNNPNSPDFVGFTTLTCLLDPIAAGTVPSVPITSVSGTNVTLTWWGSAYATNYLVKRATVSGGPYTTIGTVSSSVDRYFSDSTATNGGTYYYAVSALDKFGESANSPEKSITILNQLVAYYKFNETNFATAADASGFGHPAAIFMNGATNVSGKFGNAVNLNGSSQYVALPNGLLTGLGDFTIATWVYLNSVNNWSRIFDFGADTDRYMFLTPSTGSVVCFAITKFTGAGEQQINGTAPLSTGWHHVAVTLKGTEGSGVGVLYVDGLAVGTNGTMCYTPDMIGSLVNATNNYLGRSAFAGDPYLNGKVDDFRIYNGALSAAQVTALYLLTPVAPAAPATVTATAASASVVNLSWTASSGATNYLVQRSLTSGGSYALVASGVTATNYTDTGLSGNTVYYYVIAAVNSGGQGTNSVQASAITLTPPAIPSSLTATGMYGGQIALSWGASGGATSYNLKRSLYSGGPYVTMATGVTTAGYTNSGLLFNATYYYVVSAVNANGESPNSSEAGSIVPVPTLVWKGNVNTNWDVNQTTNWLYGGSPSTYFVDGAAATFNDTATSSSVNLSAGVSPYSVTFSNSTLSYTVGSANNSGIGGAASITKLGTGTATLTGTNTFTGDITLNGGGTLAINGLLGGGNYSGNLVNYSSTFNYNSTASQTLSGIISQSGTILKTGTGILIISGDDAHTGATTVRQGTLNLTGSAKTGSSGVYIVDNNAASTTNAVLNISSSVTAARIWLGDRAGSGQVGAACQISGDVVLTQAASVDDFRIGSVASGRGYYKLSGGTLTVNEVGIGGSQNDTIGILDIVGGSFTDNGWLNVARGGGASSGLLNITGGSASAARVDMNWAGTSGAVSIINVGGGSNPASLTAAASTSLGVNLANTSTTAGTMSVVNLLTNGTLTTGIVRADQTSPTTLLNFNGGTLQANISAGNFLTDGNIDSVYVYPKGGTIDNGGKSVAIDRPLLAPTGTGVSSITGPSVQGSGYVGAPLVTITGGTGSGATAYAVMADDGTGKGAFKVTSIVVTSPGVYTAAPTTVTLTGGGASTAASGFSISTAANTSGGMTFAGTGTTTLSGANTYAGPTVISGGTVKQGGPLLYLSFDNTNGTTVVNGGSGGAVMNGTLTGTNVSIASGGHAGKALLVSNGPVNTGYVLVNNAGTLFHGNTTNSACTLALWIKTTSTGGSFLYQGFGGWASGNTSFFLTSATQASSGSYPGGHVGGVRWGGGWMGGNSNVNDGNWHFIAITDNSGAKTIYVDGNLDASYTASQMWNTVATGNQLWIGGTADTGDGNAPFNGLIDEVFVYGRSLNQSEITNLMNGVVVSSPVLPTGTDLTVASGAALVLNGSAQAVGALSGGNSGTIQLGAGSTSTAFAFGKNTSTTFAGSITGSGSVTKLGAGDITLSGINAYSGATTISNGVVRFGQSDNTNYVASLAPLLWFNFDQGVDLVDGVVTNLGLGGSAMNAILNGNAAVTNGGRYGSALYLDGASYLEIDNQVTPLDCNATGASWTYALWIKTATSGATFGYQGDGFWSAGTTTFYLNNNSVSGGKAGGVRYGDGWLTGTATLNNNAWHFVAITVSGGVKTIYVDGNVDAQTGATGWAGAALTTANQFWIGGSPDGGDGVASFNGLIDEVYMFNRALSQSEVQNILSNKTVVATGIVTGQLPAASPVSLASTATLDLAGTTQAIASLSDIGGSGGVVTNSSGTTASLLINITTTNTFSGAIRDAAPASAISLLKSGNGTQTLNGANNFSGNVTVNGGTLAFDQATLPTNAIVTVTNGAVLSLNFAGTNRVTGIVLNGASQSPGVYNAASSAPYLAGTGSLLIGTPVATNPTNISYSISGGNLTLVWPVDHTGWQLQVQTNPLTFGLGTNWVTVPGSDLTNQMLLPVNSMDGSVFFRLRFP